MLYRAFLGLVALSLVSGLGVADENQGIKCPEPPCGLADTPCSKKTGKELDSCVCKYCGTGKNASTPFCKSYHGGACAKNARNEVGIGATAIGETPESPGLADAGTKFEPSDNFANLINPKSKFKPMKQPKVFKGMLTPPRYEDPQLDVDATLKALDLPPVHDVRKIESDPSDNEVPNLGGGRSKGVVR